MIIIGFQLFIPIFVAGSLIVINNMAAPLPGPFPPAPAPVPVPHGNLALHSSSDWNLAHHILAETPSFVQYQNRYPETPLNGGPTPNAIRDMLSSGINNTQLIYLQIDNRTLTQGSNLTPVPWAITPTNVSHLVHLRPFALDIAVNGFYESGIFILPLTHIEHISYNCRIPFFITPDLCSYNRISWYCSC